jgi:hypothetical protein
MAKYSSDSESDHSSNKYRRKHSRRSSSLDSSDSSPSHQRRQKYSKSRRRYHSRSRSRDKDRSSKSYRHLKETSKDKKRYRTQRSKSSSLDRHHSKKRSASREKSSSRSSSSQSNVKTDKPSTNSKEFLTNDLKIKSSVFDELNNDEFIPKQFISSAKNKESKIKNIIIDMNADVIHIPPITNTCNFSNSIFHTSIMADKELKFDKWVKKLYSLRQKAVTELNYA